MQIDATTFVLELINFAVLVWLLNRFLFRPIMAVMDGRRGEIEQDVQKAQALRDTADKLRAQYEGRIAEWEKEKEAARDTLNKELADQRAKGVEAARQAVAQETQRLAAAEEKKRAAWQRATEQRALEQAGQFAAKLLERVSGLELDNKLGEVFLTDLAAWPQDKLDALLQAAQAAEGKVTVATARPLSPEMKRVLENTLSDTLGTPCRIDNVTEASVISGLRLTMGPLVVQADIGDELAFFAQKAAHDG